MRGNIRPLIRAGVTGHRRLANPEILRERLQEIFARLAKIARQAGKNPRLLVLSPLAEGADRLAVRAAGDKAELEVVLPLEQADYMEDFVTPESKIDFETLLLQAPSPPHILPPQLSRSEAYRAVGLYVIEHCDVLIALWDGAASRGHGGTGEIVELARSQNKPLIWLNTHDPSLVCEENIGGLLHSVLQRKYHDIYMNEEMDLLQAKEPSELYTKTQLNELSRCFTCEENQEISQQKKHILNDRLASICEHLQPDACKAGILAGFYQRKYRWYSKWIYTLAAAAVIIVTGQYLFAGPPWLIMFEIGAMLAILVLIKRGRTIGLHRRWLDYRLLSERLRIAQFMWFIGVEELEVSKHEWHCGWVEKSWMFEKFRHIWISRPHMPPMEECTFPLLKSYIRSSWIEDQKNFHHEKKKEQRRKQKRISLVGETFYFLTLAAAFMHLLHINDGFNGRIWTFLAITLPIIATALSGLRAHFEYKKTANQSTMMINALENMLASEWPKISDLHALKAFARKVERLMIQENADWHESVHVHELEAPG